MITNNTYYLISKTLEEDPVLRMGFERNLISAGALAKHIANLNPEQVLNSESLRTAIRRLKRNSNKIDILGNAAKILSNAYLHVRNNMVKIEFKKDESTLHLINKSFKINELYNNELFRLIKGHSVLHAIVEEVNLDKIVCLFDGKIINIEKGLCEFIVIFPDLGTRTPGILLTLINELSMNNINIVQGFSCGTEINIIVSEKENQKAYNILTNLLKRCRLSAADEKIAM
jgi:aspartokinase